MAHRYVRKLRLASLISFSDVRYFHPAPATFNVLAAPSSLLAEYSTSVSSSSSSDGPLEALRNRKAADLRSFLSLPTPSPQRVWGNYIDLLQFYGRTKVPLDIHQSVLRKCSPPPAHVRALAARKRAAGHKYNDVALYESRFQTIIRNIRSAGDTPALEDYHCALAFFAAVGNHESAMMVLQEIGRMGLVKKPQTYALCLRALAHRLTLPTWHLDRPALVDEITEHCMNIVKEMTSGGAAYVSHNVDIAFRILKETMDMEGFSSFMRNAFGIDMSYPDRPPLEYWGKIHASGVQVQDGAPVHFPNQLPFSLHPFNTALDYLGKSGNVSKLVQLFEIATTPLPPSSTNPAFDDDDDDDFGVSNPQVAPYKPPRVQPNTTSFQILLKWISKADHAVLARHYLLVALEHERREGRQLREWTVTRPPDQIPSPRVTVNRNIFLPVFSFAIRNKNKELLCWVLYRIRRVTRRKQFDINYYTKVRAHWTRTGVYRPTRPVDSDLTDETNEDLPSAAASSRFSTFFNPSSSPHSQPDEALKVFNIDRHITILQLELDQLVAFEERVEHALARTIQRIKERLGRRVWAGKNVFMRDAGQRTVVSRAAWRASVNFRSQKDVEAALEARRRKRAARMLEQARGRQRAFAAAAPVGEQRRDGLPPQIPGE